MIFGRVSKVDMGSQNNSHAQNCAFKHMHPATQPALNLTLVCNSVLNL